MEWEYIRAVSFIVFDKYAPIADVSCENGIVAYSLHEFAVI